MYEALLRYHARLVKLAQNPRTYRVYRFDSETDDSEQTLLGEFPTEAAAIEYARRNGGHQVQDSYDGEPINIEPERAPESDDEAAARADHEHDQAKDDRATGDR